MHLIYFHFQINNKNKIHRQLLNQVRVYHSGPDFDGLLFEPCSSRWDLSVERQLDLQCRPDNNNNINTNLRMLVLLQFYNLYFG